MLPRAESVRVVCDPCAPWLSLSVVCIFTALLLVYHWSPRKSFPLRIPRVGRDPKNFLALSQARDDFMNNGRRLVEEGYAMVRLEFSQAARNLNLIFGTKHKYSMFIVQTADMERVILSNKYADELRSCPLTQLSSKDAQCERHLAWWNTLDVVKKSDLHISVSRVQLSQHLCMLEFSRGQF